MKIRFALILAHLLFLSNLFSQSGEIIYEAEMIPIDYESKLKSDTISETQKASLRAIFKNQPKVLYQLVFDKNESSFEKQNSLNSDKNSFNIAETKMGKGVYYTNNT